MKPSPQGNEELRIDQIDPLDSEGQSNLLMFLRQFNATHLFWEYLLPAAHQEGGAICLAAIRDRPWPPWGLAASSVRALLHIYPLHTNSAGIGGLIVPPTEFANIGMMAALYKEGLEQLIGEDRSEIGYLVREDSRAVERVLAIHGFARVEDVPLVDHSRYVLLTATAETLLKGLGLSSATTEELLRFQFPDTEVFDRNALFHSVLQLAQWPWIQDPANPGELMPNPGWVSGPYDPGPQPDAGPR
jgi:hypothetical protein